MTEADANKIALSPRFCIAEQHGIQLAKYRVIDDLTRSQVNSTAETKDTYCPESLDVLVAQARRFARHGNCNLKAWSVDFSNAYKTSGLHDESKKAATVCFARPSDNKPFKAQILAQPFGSKRAPANWGRVVTFVQFLARTLLSLVVAAYVDDIFCCEPITTCRSGFWAFKALTKLIGFPTADRKDQEPSEDLYLLGAAVSIDSVSIRAEACPERVRKLRALISEALSKDTLTPAEASKLRGKLGFYTTLLAGKLGRGMMGQLIARQYYERTQTITHNLRRSLVWWLSALGNLSPRRANLYFEKPVGAHTDAQGLGHVAAVFTTNGRTAVSTHLPQWFLDWIEKLPGESPIFIYELCAAVLLAYCAREWRGISRTCVVCIDNKAAVATLVKGSSTSPIGTLLANLFWTVATQGNTTWWIEYVHTKSNIADQPSRQRTRTAGKPCNKSTRNVPIEFEQTFATWTSLHREATVVKFK